MLFKKKNCPLCQKEIDETLSFCPYCKNEIEQMNPQVNNSMPWIDLIRQILLFLIGFVGIQIISFIASIVASIIAIQITKGNAEEAQKLLLGPDFNFLINLICYLLIFIGLIIIIIPYLKLFFSQFKSLKRFLKGISYGALLILISSLYSLIISFFTKAGGNINQQTIIEMTKSYPIPSFILFGLIGPICEELTYRVGMFNFMLRTKRWIAYLVTSLIFGLLHFNFVQTSTEGFLLELVNLPSYIIAGLILSYAYEKDGFASSVYAHTLNNVFGIISIIITSNIPK